MAKREENRRQKQSDRERVMKSKDGMSYVGDDPHLVECSLVRAHKLEISGSYGKRPPRAAADLGVQCDCGSLPPKPASRS